MQGYKDRMISGEVPSPRGIDPNKIKIPTNYVDESNDNFTIDGLRYEFLVMRETENPTQLFFGFNDEGIIILQDVIYNGSHTFVYPPFLANWIDTLNLLQSLDMYTLLLCGHGFPTDTSYYDVQINYLNTVSYLIDEHDTFESYVAALDRAYPDYTGLDITEIYRPFIPKYNEGAVESPSPSPSTSSNVSVTAVSELENNGNVLIQPSVNGVVENELIEAGYVPVDRVVIKNRDRVECHYIKVITSRGHIAYVNVSDNVTTTTSCEDRVFSSMVTNAEIVPYSIKKGALECAGLDVCGVVFECRDSVCTVERDGVNDMRDTNYVLNDYDINANNIRVSDNIQSYPIVRYQDIRENPDMVKIMIQDSFSKLRDITLAKTTSKVSDLQEILAATHASSITTLGYINDSIRSIYHRVREAESMLNEYDGVTLNEEEKGNPVLLGKAILDFNQVSDSIARRAVVLSSYRDQLLAIQNSMNDQMIAIQKEMEILLE
jgi:hypothetical protein